MTDDASREAAGAGAGGPVPPVPKFTVRKVPPPTAAERRARRKAMDRAIRFGAAPYRDGEGKARYVFFKEANNAPVEARRRDPQAKRGFRKTQQARKAAGQLIWHPEDQIELAKRLGVIYYREGRSAEGAAERGVYDAIWRYEHVWDSFTVPRRIGPDIIETGRIAAVAEEEARKLQAKDPRAEGGFFVRDRKNNGLIYVVANADPSADDTVAAGADETVLVGDTEAPGFTTPPTGEGAPSEVTTEAASRGSEASGISDVTDETAGQADDAELDPHDELELLRQLGVDIDAPTLPGTRVHTLKEATTTRIEQPVSDDLLPKIANEFEQEWRALQRYGIRYYMHPELREAFDALPDVAELAEIVKSLIPGGGEAQSLLDYNEAAKRFVEHVSEGDITGGQQAAVDAVNGLAGAIPVVGRAGKVPKAVQRFKRASEAAKSRKVVPSQRPLQVVLEKTPGYNEPRRLVQIRQRTQLLVPKGFLDQTASQAIAKTRFPPRTHLENVQRGLAAVDLVIEQALRGQPGVLVNAMHRSDVGAVTFLFGKPGILNKKYKKGGGLSHVIAKHGADVVGDVIETIAKGTVV